MTLYVHCDNKVSLSLSLSLVTCGTAPVALPGYHIVFPMPQSLSRILYYIPQKPTELRAETQTQKQLFFFRPKHNPKNKDSHAPFTHHVD